MMLESISSVQRGRRSERAARAAAAVGNARYMRAVDWNFGCECDWRGGRVHIQLSFPDPRLSLSSLLLLSAMTSQIFDNMVTLKWVNRPNAACFETQEDDPFSVIGVGDPGQQVWSVALSPSAVFVKPVTGAEPASQ